MGKVQEQILQALARNDALEQAQLARDAAETPPGLDDYAQRWADEARRVLREGR